MRNYEAVLLTLTIKVRANRCLPLLGKKALLQAHPLFGDGNSIVYQCIISKIIK